MTKQERVAELRELFDTYYDIAFPANTTEEKSQVEELIDDLENLLS